jgi:hypothetical protein
MGQKKGACDLWTTLTQDIALQLGIKWDEKY